MSDAAEQLVQLFTRLLIEVQRHGRRLDIIETRHLTDSLNIDDIDEPEVTEIIERCRPLNILTADDHATTIVEDHPERSIPDGGW